MRCFKRVIACFLIVSMLMLTACASMQSGEPLGGCGTWSSPTSCIIAHTAGGVAVGAVLGVVGGKLAGGGKKTGTGAIVGAVSGGLVAFAIAWGKCFACFTKIKSEPIENYEKTQRLTGYSPVQGTSVKINRATLLPSAVAPGNKVALRGNYYVMFPADRKEISITETAVLKVYDENEKKFVEVGQSPETIVVSPGLRKADSEIPIPDNAEEGKFLIVFVVTADGKSDSLEMPFVVTKDKAVLSRAKADAERIIAAGQEERSREQAMPIMVAKTEGSTSSGEKTTEIGKCVVIIANKVNLWQVPHILDTDSQI